MNLFQCLHFENEYFSKIVYRTISFTAFRWRNQPAAPSFRICRQHRIKAPAGAGRTEPAGTCGSLRRPCPYHSAVRTRSERYPQGSLGDRQPSRSSPALPAGAMCPFFPCLKSALSKFEVRLFQTSKQFPFISTLSIRYYIIQLHKRKFAFQKESEKWR